MRVPDSRCSSGKSNIDSHTYTHSSTHTYADANPGTDNGGTDVHIDPDAYTNTNANTDSGACYGGSDPHADSGGPGGAAF